MKYSAPYGSLDPDAPYVDRSTPNVISGSVPTAKAIEAPQREIEAVIKAAGLTPSNGDLTQLLQALRFYFAQFPIYPECVSANRTFDVSAPSTGTIRIPAGVNWVMRGATRYSTSADVNLTTTSSKTYHLRWDAANGFRLRSLADVAYNPGALADADPAFDSTYDDMLIARVVTDVSNIATIVNLINSARLIRQQRVQKTLPSALNWATLAASGVTLNWARTPIIKDPMIQGFRSFSFEPDGNEHPTGGIMRAFEIRVPAAGVTRYAAPNVEYWYEDSTVNDGYLNFIWSFQA